MRAFFSATAIVFFMSANLLGADQSAEVKAVLDKAIKAHGGTEKLSKVKGQSWSVNGKMFMGEMAMPYKGEYYFGAPDCFRFDIDVQAGTEKTQLSMATDGKIAWEKANDMVRDMEEKKAKSVNHNVYTMGLNQLTILNDKAFSLTPLGESKHEDHVLVGIKVSREGRRDVSLYFDKATGLLTKASTVIFEPDFERKDVVQDVFFTGYKDKDGMKIFDKLTIFHDGNKYIVEELSGQKFLDKVDQTKFAKPKE